MPRVPEIAARIPHRFFRLGIAAGIARASDRPYGAWSRPREAVAKHLPSAYSAISLESRVGPLSAAVGAHLDAGDRRLPRERDPDDLLRPHLRALAVSGAADDRFDVEGRERDHLIRWDGRPRWHRLLGEAIGCLHVETFSLILLDSDLR